MLNNKFYQTASAMLYELSPETCSFTNENAYDPVKVTFGEACLFANALSIKKGLEPYYDIKLFKINGPLGGERESLMII